MLVRDVISTKTMLNVCDVIIRKKIRETHVCRHMFTISYYMMKCIHKINHIFIMVSSKSHFMYEIYN